MNFNNRKTQKMISTIIIIILVGVMIIPTVLTAIMGMM